MSFLFDTSGKRTNAISNVVKNTDGDNTLYNDISKKNVGKYYVAFKKQTKASVDNVKDFLKNASLYGVTNDTDENPYSSLLNKFKGTAMEIKPADLAFLRDLGVSPVNRLIILRRYAEGVVVPNNLTKLDKTVRPISTVIGWLPNEPTEFLPFSVSFNEEWEKVTAASDRLDMLIKEVLNTEVGGKIGDMLGNLSPIPSWSQGILFKVLYQMGLTEFKDASLPLGDPNVNKIAISRPFEDSSNHLKGEFQTLEFKTVYEQKYFDNKDSSNSFLDVINNILKMGTSNMKFILSQSSDLISKFRTASQKSDWEAWGAFIQKFVSSFIEVFSNDVKAGITSISSAISNTVNNTNNGQKTTSDTMASKVKSFPDQVKGDAANGNTPTDKKDSDLAGITSLITSTIGNLANTILAGTISRYKWRFKGSLGLMTGEATTGWHLQVGNPLNPILSLNNVIVDNVTLNLSNDLSFNDMPKQITANIKLRLGRELGKQEILQAFNNGYVRIYSDPKRK